MRSLLLAGLMLLGCGISGPDDEIHFEWRGVVGTQEEYVRIDRAQDSSVITGVWVLPSACLDLDLIHERHIANILELRVVSSPAQVDGCVSAFITAIYTIALSASVEGDSVIVLHNETAVLRAALE